MTEHEQQHFDMLQRGPCVTPEYAKGYYGLAWPLPGDASLDFDRWVNQRRRDKCGDGVASRYELEGFLQQQAVVPKKWMGARLGMTVASLDELLARLADIGMRPNRYIVYPDLVAESLSEDIVPNLPGLKFRTFSDHNTFCARLHADLDKVLGIKVQPLFCATSDRIGDDYRKFASHFDCITLDPLSGRHQMWLDFRKPLNLGPDRCSKLLYTENQEVMRPFCAGACEPADLERYELFLSGQHA